MSGGVGWTPELRAAVRAQQEAAAGRAVAAARDAGADAIVLPGDLWDADGATVPQLRGVLDALASFAGPVLVAPGARDGPGRLPFGDEAFRDATGLGAWPANVHLFAGPAWSAFRLPGRDDVVALGRAHDGGPLPDPHEAPAPVSLLVASAPAGARVPAGWAWGAFGGRAAEDVLEEGALRGAYAGPPVPASFEEAGASFLLVRLAAGADPFVERLPSSGLRFLDLAVAVDELGDAAILQQVARRLEDAGAGARDAVRVTLHGTPLPEARLALGPLSAGLLHLTVRDRTERPSAGEAPGTAEGRFAEEMRLRIASAADEREQRVLSRALALGRAALAGRPLPATPRGDA